jgi:hypothetical protein
VPFGAVIVLIGVTAVITLAGAKFSRAGR